MSTEPIQLGGKDEIAAPAGGEVGQQAVEADGGEQARRGAERRGHQHEPDGREHAPDASAGEQRVELIVAATERESVPEAVDARFDHSERIGQTLVGDGGD